MRERVRTHEISFEADDFPCFLWEGEKANIQNTKKGFLRGEILVRVCNLPLLFHPLLTILIDHVGRLAWTFRCTDR